MIIRRTAAPDIAGCVLCVFAGTLLFSLLHGFYSGSTLAAIAPQVAIFFSLLAACSGVALGIFARRGWARGAGLLIFLLAFGAAVFNFHVPGTAQLPLGILSLL